MNQQSIDGLGQKLTVSERDMVHPKSQKKCKYVSFSNGQDVCGVYVETEKLGSFKKELAKFLTEGDNGGKQRGRPKASND